MNKEDENSKAAGGALCWNKPEEVLAWLALVRDHILDAVAAGDDATRPISKRVLSRAEARRKIYRAEKDLVRLLAAAKRGVPSAEILEPAERDSSVAKQRPA